MNDPTPNPTPSPEGGTPPPQTKQLAGVDNPLLQSGKGKVQLRKILVQVTPPERGDAIKTEIFEHELKLLRISAGDPHAVKVIDREFSIVDVPDDAAAEYQRLQNRWNNKSRAIVHFVYDDAEAVADATGLALPDGDAYEPVQAVVKANKPEPTGRVPTPKGKALKKR